MDKNDRNQSMRRAAAFLIAIGPSAAAEVMRNFDEDTVIRLTSEMAHIESLSPTQKEEIIGDFMVEINRIKIPASAVRLLRRKYSLNRSVKSARVKYMTRRSSYPPARSSPF